MKANINIFKSIRGFSLIAIVSIVLSAFIFDIDFVQALVYNPIAIMVATALLGYAQSQIEQSQEGAKIHRLEPRAKQLKPAADSTRSAGFTGKAA